MSREVEPPIPLPIIMFTDKRRLRTVEQYSAAIKNATTDSRRMDLLYDFYEKVYGFGLKDMDSLHKNCCV